MIRHLSQWKQFVTLPACHRALSKLVPLLSLCLLTLSCVATAQGIAVPEPSSRASTIVVGRVVKEPKEHIPKLQKMADYFAERLAHLDITNGDVLVAKNNQQMIQFLDDGLIDVVSETPLSALAFAEQAQAEILLRERRKGVANYRTIFFVRKDSHIHSLAELRGQRIAFEDPGSTSAFLVPLAILKRNGLETIELSSPRIRAPADKVGYVFAGGEFSLAVWVHRGVAAAGAFSNLDWAELTEGSQRLKEDLRIVHAGAPMIHTVLLVRNGLREDVKSAIKGILLEIHRDPKAKDVLKAYGKVTQYDEITGDVMSSLDEARETYEFIREELH